MRFAKLAFLVIGLYGRVSPLLLLPAGIDLLPGLSLVAAWLKTRQNYVIERTF